MKRNIILYAKIKDAINVQAIELWKKRNSYVAANQGADS